MNICLKGLLMFEVFGIPIDAEPRPNGAFELKKMFWGEIINILE